jgi:hypothetical protein
MDGIHGTRGGMATVKVELEAWAWIEEGGIIALSLDQNPDNTGDGESDLEFTFVELIEEYSTNCGDDYEKLLGLRNVFDNAASYIDRLVSNVEEDNLGVDD